MPVVDAADGFSAALINAYQPIEPILVWLWTAVKLVVVIRAHVAQAPRWRWRAPASFTPLTK